MPLLNLKEKKSVKLKQKKLAKTRRKKTKMTKRKKEVSRIVSKDKDFNKFFHSPI